MGLSHNAHPGPLTPLGWVPEGSLAGFFGCVFEIWPAPGAVEGPGECGGWGRSPPQFVKTYLRLVTHFEFIIVGPDEKMVAKVL